MSSMMSWPYFRPGLRTAWLHALIGLMLGGVLAWREHGRLAACNTALAAMRARADTLAAEAHALELRLQQANDLLDETIVTIQRATQLMRRWVELDR
jgi:hypothetical protein